MRTFAFPLSLPVYISVSRSLEGPQGSEAENQLFWRLVVGLAHRGIFVTLNSTHTLTQTGTHKRTRQRVLFEPYPSWTLIFAHTQKVLITCRANMQPQDVLPADVCYRHICVFLQTGFLKTVSHETRAMRLSFELMWHLWLQLRTKQLLLTTAAVCLILLCSWA